MSVFGLLSVLYSISFYVLGQAQAEQAIAGGVLCTAVSIATRKILR